MDWGFYHLLIGMITSLSHIWETRISSIFGVRFLAFDFASQFGSSIRHWCWAPKKNPFHLEDLTMVAWINYPNIEVLYHCIMFQAIFSRDLRPYIYGFIMFWYGSLGSSKNFATCRICFVFFFVCWGTFTHWDHRDSPERTRSARYSAWLMLNDAFLCSCRNP